MATIEAVDYTSADASERFVASLRSTGFGVLKNHPIPEKVVTNIYQQWNGFFTSEDKQNYLFEAETYDGFFPREQAETAKGHTVRDIKEYFHFYPWGKCPAELKPDLDAYYQQTIEFASTLLAWVEQHTPKEIASKFSEPLSEMIRSSEQSLLRVLFYPPLDNDVDPSAIRAGAHEDINLLTLLPAANEPGLQVKAKNGEWLDVPCDFGNLIINIGDMLQEASGGYFPSTTHRVINPEGHDATRARISLPLFLHPRPDVVLSDRYSANSYLQERLEELRSSDKS